MYLFVVYFTEKLVQAGHIKCPECRQEYEHPVQGFPVCRLARSIRELVGQRMGEFLTDQNKKETVNDSVLPSSQLKSADDWPGIDQ